MTDRITTTASAASSTLAPLTESDRLALLRELEARADELRGLATPPPWARWLDTRIPGTRWQESSSPGREPYLVIPTGVVPGTESVLLLRPEQLVRWLGDEPAQDALRALLDLAVAIRAGRVEAP